MNKVIFVLALLLNATSASAEQGASQKIIRIPDAEMKFCYAGIATYVGNEFRYYSFSINDNNTIIVKVQDQDGYVMGTVELSFLHNTYITTQEFVALAGQVNASPGRLALKVTYTDYQVTTMGIVPLKLCK